MNGFPTEPSGDLREMAHTLWEVFVAYRQAGFTDDQAFQLVKAMLTSNVLNSQ